MNKESIILLLFTFLTTLVVSTLIAFFILNQQVKDLSKQIVNLQEATTTEYTVEYEELGLKDFEGLKIQLIEIDGKIVPVEQRKPISVSEFLKVSDWILQTDSCFFERNQRFTRKENLILVQKNPPNKSNRKG